mmetsp:Transcript_122771/g.212923  ORF Transcript_122771/g.212923 Transcript_122771/m.212923 type:complete len:233 (-) Transcript_122771:1128-1826(-)
MGARLWVWFLGLCAPPDSGREQRRHPMTRVDFSFGVEQPGGSARCSSPPDDASASWARASSTGPCHKGTAHSLASAAPVTMAGRGWRSTPQGLRTLNRCPHGTGPGRPDGPSPHGPRHCPVPPPPPARRAGSAARRGPWTGHRHKRKCGPYMRAASGRCGCCSPSSCPARSTRRTTAPPPLPGTVPGAGKSGSHPQRTPRWPPKTANPIFDGGSRRTSASHQWTSPLGSHLT